MSILPNSQILIQIGPFAITFYAIFILSGAMIAYLAVKKKFLKMGYSKQLIDDFAFYLLPIAIIGARIWYVVFEWPQYANNPISVLYIHQGGLAIHGGLLFGIIFGIVYFKKHKIDVFRMADLILPFVLLAQAIGRWGNFINQEAFGRIVSEKYFQYFPTFIKNQMLVEGEYREPTFLYESLLNGIGFLLLYFIVRKHRKKYGDIAFSYLIYYGVIRFIIESFRSDSLLIFGFKTAQLVSIAFVIIGVMGLLFKESTKPIIGFDLDGTLIKSEKLIIDSFKHTFQTLRPELNITEETYRSFLGNTLEQTFKQYDEVNYQKYIDVYREFNFKHHDAYVTLYENAEEVLRYLKQNNYYVAIISSKKRELIVRAMELLSIEQYIDTIVGYEDSENHKPDPQPLKNACNQLGIGHDSLIYIGDSEQDILAAKNIGCFSIAVLFDESRKQRITALKADKYITNLSEIITIVKEKRVWENTTI